MKWLIVEDALKDRKGHWAEYVETFRVGLSGLGDEVTILADHNAEEFIIEGIQAKPLLPASIWHRMSDESSRMRRYGRVPYHAWKTIQVMKRWLRTNPAPEVIFVPTVLVHHLLAWYWLIRFGIVPPESRVLLFFPNMPLQLSDDGHAVWTGGPTTKLLGLLFAALKPFVHTKRVIVGVETYPMQTALGQLTGLSVTYLPHPVRSATIESATLDRPITLACYGAARLEKGSNILQLAVAGFLAEERDIAARFVIQWIDDFQDQNGQLVQPRTDLEESGKVEFIRRYFRDGEYAKQLSETDVIMLPYQRHAYNVRVSRVVIEAMIQGLPVIATNQTTMSDQLEEFGAGITFCDGSLDELVSGIKKAVSSFSELRAQAIARQEKAQRHFSVSNFRSLLRKHIEVH